MKSNYTIFNTSLKINGKFVPVDHIVECGLPYSEDLEDELSPDDNLVYSENGEIVANSEDVFLSFSQETKISVAELCEGGVPVDTETDKELDLETGDLLVNK